MATRSASSRGPIVAENPCPTGRHPASALTALRYNPVMGYAEDLRAVIPAGASGEVLYVYASIDSTNSRAAELARDGAPAGTLVVADHQTRGRGRRGARWTTPPGEAIAMSLILRPESASLRWTGLGALAVVEALAAMDVAGSVKWPNDVVLGGRKVAGVLAEVVWDGDRLAFLILGIGVNVGRGAAPPDSEVEFPATSVEREAGRRIDRVALTAEIVRKIDAWAPRVGTAAFLRRWEAVLAFRGERVRLSTPSGDVVGLLRGLGNDGEAAIETADGSILSAGPDAVGLRPAGG